MALKSLLLLIGLMLCLNFKQNEALTITQDKADSLEKWETVGMKAGEVGQKHDLSSAIALIDALGKAIPYAGPLATLVSGIMGFFVHSPSEMSIVLDKLEGMNKKLDHLDDRLGEVMVKIETVSIISGYKSKVEEISRLKHSYERFISTNNVAINNLTRDDFLRECKANKMLDFAHWINGEMNTESQLPLRQVMLQNYDMREYNYWSNQIAAMLSNAMFLHTTCVGASGYNESTISLTLNGRNGDSGDIHTFQQVLISVRKSFQRGMKKIKHDFFAHAKQEVEEFMRVHADVWHDQFAKLLVEMLEGKYYWRRWSAYSWNGNTRGYEQHAITANGGNVWFWMRVYNQCLYVGSVLSDWTEVITPTLEHCHSTAGHLGGELALSIRNHVASCITSPSLGGVAVVRFDNNLRGYGQGSFFRNDNYNGHDFSVIAMPNDASSYAKGEVCDSEGNYCSNVDTHCCGKNQCCDD